MLSDYSDSTINDTGWQYSLALGMSQLLLVDVQYVDAIEGLKIDTYVLVLFIAMVKSLCQ